MRHGRHGRGNGANRRHDVPVSYTHLDVYKRQANRWSLVGRATTEVGPALFLSLIIVTLSFLPVLALQGEEGRLFAPLAYTKTYAMAAAALLSITLVPVLLGLFVRGRLRGEQENPVNRALMAAYRPLLAWVMRCLLYTSRCV